jgi:hypothetical protein
MSVPETAGAGLHNQDKRTGFDRKQALALALLAVAVFVLFLTSPRHGEFWWSDAPRHAMDGVFYHDLIRDMPIGHIKQYAMDYYLKYPALAALFYPPLFPLVEALFFAVFGVSHFTAQLTVAVFYLAAAWGAYCLSRRWLSPAYAFAASLLFVGAPEVALWGRQVMLEIPACAFLIWSAYAMLRFLDTRRPRVLYMAVLLVLAGVYTKQTVSLIVPVFVYLCWKSGVGLRSRGVRGALALLVAGVLPLAAVTLRFGFINVNSVVGGQWTTMPVMSIASWTFYARRLPEQVGWPVLALAAAGLLYGLLRKAWRDEGFLVCGLWLLTGYVFFSAIALKEPRHTVLILLPVEYFAIYCLGCLVPKKVSSYLALGVATAGFAYTMSKEPVPAVEGYRDAVAYVAAHAPRNSVVLFSGYRDGSFIFNMRAQPDRPDLAVLRADKILLRVAQRRELGVEERNLSTGQIAEMLDHFGISYVVNQANFWDDLVVMQRFQEVLKRGNFAPVAKIPVSGNVSRDDHWLEIYARNGPVNPAGEKIRVELPIVNTVVEGTLGKATNR